MPAFEMDWRDVLFVSYPVDPEAVQPHLPDQLTVETFEGDAYLSVVPLVIANIRPAGLPAALGVTTPELNLRTYVTCEDPAGGSETPGVYFFSLDADDLLGSAGGRLFNHLPYYWADIDYDPGSPTRFASRRRTPGTRSVRFRGRYEPDGDPFQPDPGTVQHFHTERYRYFTEAQDGTIRYATLDHDPWTLQPAAWEISENTLFAANNFDRPDSEPVVAYSRSLHVRASASERWGPE